MATCSLVVDVTVKRRCWAMPVAATIAFALFPLIGIDRASGVAAKAIMALGGLRIEVSGPKEVKCP